MGRNSSHRFVQYEKGKWPTSLLSQRQITAVRSHHPEVQRELSNQVELLRSTDSHEISELLEHIGQLTSRMASDISFERTAKFKSQAGDD